MRWRPPILLTAIARAIVWAALLPNFYVTVLLLLAMGHAPPLRTIVEMALAVGALVVTRPLLATERARSQFAPLALRPWFLASAIGAMATGITLARLAQSFSHFPMLARDTIGLAVLAVPLVVAGAGVIRMRAWGVVLGALTARGSIPIVSWMRDSLLTLPVLLACAPAALMPALVVAARTRNQAVAYRVAPRLRVAADDDSATMEPCAEEEAALAHAAQ